MKRGGLHKKLLHNLAYSPALVEQTLRYEKKLKSEARYRKISLILMSFSAIVYIFVALSTNHRLDYVAQQKLAVDIKQTLAELPDVSLTLALSVIVLIILLSTLIYIRISAIRKVIKLARHNLHQGSI